MNILSMRSCGFPGNYYVQTYASNCSLRQPAGAIARYIGFRGVT